MPNILDGNGLQTATRAEILAYYTAQMRAIYGADINLASDTPDGQMINLFIQSVLDLQDLLTQVYNTFDPDNAIGKVLDQRVAINGIQRQAGTFTVTPITIVASQSVNLYGLDQDAQEIYTVADNAGNLWELQVTELGVTAGTHVYNFQAAIPGAQLTIPNTITVPITIVLGITSVNNPTTYSTLGINEETDAVLKVRRQKSVSLASQGYLAGLLAALENINGVTSAFVYENDTDATNVDGVPSHSIWVIVAGTGAEADIANAIYTKRNAGCGMFGSIDYTITQIDGSPFIVSWDDVTAVNLYIAFTATSINGTTAPNIAAIRAGLATSFIPGVNEEVNINALATLAQTFDSNCLVTNAGFSIAQTQILTLSGVAASGAFVISYNGHASSSIAWNDAIGTIQTKLQAISGLSTATVTGSIASQTLTFNLTTITDVLSLIIVTTNTLQTVAPAAITFSYNEGYTNTLSPPSKNKQFAVAAENIIILPMQMSPSSAQVSISSPVTFTGLGGYGALVYSLSVNNSGATINGSSGLYTSGTTPNVSDTVKVTDAMGNTATAVITVIS